MSAAPGELGSYDPAFAGRHGPRLFRALSAYFRARVEGLEHLPEGPFLGVGNHSGGTLMPDTLLWGSGYHVLRGSPPLLVLAHDLMFDAYPRPLARALARLGALRASRERALAALRAGFALQVYPGGDFDAERPFARRHQIEFAGRTGWARLALEARVPVVPVVAIGGHETLVVLTDGRRLARALGLDRRLRLQVVPVSLCLPFGLFVGPLPGYLPLPAQITVRALPPLPAERYPVGAHRDPAAVADLDARVRAALQSCLDAMARARRPLLG
ncbi:MAG TPA: 1-acyl-sn-glycerol-3-phosphate acyltransferase [Polyangiaceae bacterium]|nr:1-acyl-sn-glycerol-3-phosphate acyltransferase [Polyangiaceae bacterium]